MNLLKEKKIFIAYFIIAYMLLSSLALIISYVFLNNEKDIVIKSLKDSEKTKISIQNEIILTEISDIRSDILLISKQNILLDYITKENGIITNKEKLNDDFNNLFKYVNKYSKATFFDASANKKYETSIDSLKNKENILKLNTELLKLGKNSVYISGFEQADKNSKPILKVATIVWCRENSKKGFLVLDYLGDSFIGKLNKLSKLLNSNIILLNKKSYSFITMKKNKTWNFVFNNKENYKFSSLHPNEWKIINKSNETQFLSKSGLFTSKKIYFTDSDKGEYWVLVSYILDEDIHNKSIVDNIFTTFLLAGNIFLAFLFSFIVFRRKVYLEKLEHSANYDLLTKLPNRALFYSILEQQYSHSNRYNDKFALLFIDLDGFKGVNDTYGHETGDEVLKLTAKRLNSFIRNSDIAARLGGDEFTVILMNIKNEEDVKIISEKIILQLSKEMNIRNKSINISASIGIYIYDNSKKISIDEIIQKSDKAMYIAKKLGKNRYHFSEE